MLLLLFVIVIFLLSFALYEKIDNNSSVLGEILSSKNNNQTIKNIFQKMNIPRSNYDEKIKELNILVNNNVLYDIFNDYDINLNTNVLQFKNTYFKILIRNLLNKKKANNLENHFYEILKNDLNRKCDEENFINYGKNKTGKDLYILSMKPIIKNFSPYHWDKKFEKILQDLINTTEKKLGRNFSNESLSDFEKMSEIFLSEFQELLQNKSKNIELYRIKKELFAKLKKHYEILRAYDFLKKNINDKNEFNKAVKCLSEYKEPLDCYGHDYIFGNSNFGFVKNSSCRANDADTTIWSKMEQNDEYSKLNDEDKNLLKNHLNKFFEINEGLLTVDSKISQIDNTTLDNKNKLLSNWQRDIKKEPNGFRDILNFKLIDTELNIIKTNNPIQIYNLFNEFFGMNASHYNIEIMNSNELKVYTKNLQIIFKIAYLVNFQKKTSFDVIFKLTCQKENKETFDFLLNSIPDRYRKHIFNQVVQLLKSFENVVVIKEPSLNSVPIDCFDMTSVKFPKGVQLSKVYINIIKSLRSSRLINLDEYVRIKNTIKNELKKQ